MKISDLKDVHNLPLVYEAAAKERDSENGSYYRKSYGYPANTDEILEAFDWASSAQSSGFWLHIDKGKFDIAKEICPELFEQETKIAKETKGGLMKSRYEYIRITITEKVLQELNTLGAEGWQLVVKEGNEYTFMRNK